MLNEYKQDIVIPCGGRKLACGVSRNSPRSRMVAGYLQQHGFGTLLPDLLSAEEELSSGSQYDVELLSRRLTTVTQWVIDRDL